MNNMEYIRWWILSKFIHRADSPETTKAQKLSKLIPFKLLYDILEQCYLFATTDNIVCIQMDPRNTVFKPDRIRKQIAIVNNLISRIR